MWAALTLGDSKLAFSFRLNKLNVMSWEDLGTLYKREDLDSRLEALPKLHGTLPNNTGGPILYAGGDGIYAERFAYDLIASALSKCPVCDFHFHVMNPGSFKPDEAFGDFPKTRLTWTMEEMGECQKILFSPRRYLRLAQIHRRLTRMMILVDTDSVINGDVLAALPEKFDVAMYTRPDEPWLHLAALGAFLAVPPSGRDFIDFVAAYILHFEERGIPKWFDDQFGLVSARGWLQEHVPDLAIRDIAREVVDSTGTCSPKSLIWHAKGKMKHDN